MARAAWLLLVVLCRADIARADETDKYLAAFIRQHKIPGLSVGVVRDGRLIKAAGYGMANLELGVAATRDTVYEIGSISKQFTAEAVMMLVEEGKIGLDDALAKYLPGVPAAWHAITIRHILTHQSGLKDWDGGTEFSYHREYTPTEYIAMVASSPLEFAPGERSAYTSAGYPLLGLVIEKASGIPFEQFVVSRIFQPLSMSGTRFNHPPELVPNRASGYVETQGRLQHGEPLRPALIAPSGGILTTVVDMAKWDAALGGGRLLRPATEELMRQPARLRNGQLGVSGIGWFADAFHDRRMVLHNGSTVAGFSSVVYRYLDDRLTVVILLNIDRWNAVNVAAQHVAGIYAPGVSISSLKERPDPDPARSRGLLQALRDLSEGRDPELLAANLRGRVTEERRAMIRSHVAAIGRFDFLECEDFGHAKEKLGNRIQFTCRYRIPTATGAIYYTFDLTPDGSIARFVPEED